MRFCVVSFVALCSVGFFVADAARLTSKTGRELLTNQNRKYRAVPSWGYFPKKDGTPLTEEEFYELVAAAQSGPLLFDDEFPDEEFFDEGNGGDFFEDATGNGKQHWRNKLKRTSDWRPPSNPSFGNGGLNGPAIKDRFIDSVVDLAGFPPDRAYTYSNSRALGPFGYSIAGTGGYATNGVVNALADGAVDADGNTGAVGSQTILDATDGGIAKGGTLAKVYTSPLGTFGTNLGGFLASPRASGATGGTVGGSTRPFYFSLGK